MNKLTIIGNLCNNPETRQVSTANGTVNTCRFTVAVNRRKNGGGDGEADFFSVTAWRGLADVCAKYLAKGRKVAVTGSVSARLYTAQDGTQRVSLDVTADDVEFINTGAQDGHQAPQKPAAPAPAPQQQTFTPVQDDSDLPF